MANTANWIFLMIFYFTGVAILMGILGVSGLITSDINIDTNPDVHNSFTPVYQITDYLIGGVPVCTANGSINFEEPDTLLFTYNPSDVTLSSECTTYCRNESSFFTSAISCPGLCANITDSADVNHIGCAPEDDRWNFLTGIIGFFFFSADLGLGAWNWLITVIFVYLPLLMFVLLIYYSLRSGN